MSFRRLMKMAAPYRWSLALTAALLLGETAVTLMLPLLGGQLLGGLFAHHLADHGVVLVAMLALLGAHAMLRAGSSYVAAATGETVVADLRGRLYDHVQALPLAYHDRRRHGDVLSVITNDVAHLSTFLTQTFVGLVPMGLALVGAGLQMLRTDLVLAGAALFFIPLLVVTMKLAGRTLRPLSARIQEEQGSALATASETLSMLPSIKVFTRESLESMAYRAQLSRVRDLSIRQQRLLGMLVPALQFSSACLVLLIVWLANDRIAAGQVTGPAFVSFLLYAALLLRPLSNLGSLYGQLQVARGALGRIEALLGEPTEASRQGAVSLKRANGAISFHRVTFAYPGRAPTLRDAELEISPGETVAITGLNGAGKSTLAHLLLGLAVPSQGRIAIDGVDIAAMTLDSLRQQIGLVPQHVHLRNATVADNIRFAQPDADESDIARAARLAQAHAFIEELPDGYETLIGDNGVRLSGGQRQRIALARALIKDPPILLLDEATAMFDPLGERDFISACRAVFRPRTVILITHRPASLALADRIVELVDGRLIETTPTLRISA